MGLFEVVRRLTSGMGLDLESELEKRTAACKPAASRPPLPAVAAPTGPVSSGRDFSSFLVDERDGDDAVSDNGELLRRLSEAESLNGRLKADLGRSQTAERDLAARLADLQQDARMGLSSSSMSLGP